MMLSLFIFLSMGIMDTNGSVVFRTCDYDNKDKCLDNWPCMWCNYSDISNITNGNLSNGYGFGYGYGYGSIDTYSRCTNVAPCEFNGSNFKNCEYRNEDKYKNECNVLSLFLYIMIFIGYYISMIIIYGTVNRLLISENVSDTGRKSINTIILGLTTVPLVLFLFLDLVVFYTIFLCYIILGLCIYCCIKIKDKDSDLNIIKAKKDNAYSSIN